MVYQASAKSLRTSVDFYTKRPTVFIDGKYNKSIDCLEVTKSLGVHPSSAVFKVNTEVFTYSNSYVDGRGPSTLNMLYNADGFTLLKAGQKVEVSYDGYIIFRGHIMQRADSGQSDEILFIALDHRTYLNFITVRGQIVRDSGDQYQILKFISARPTVMNPNGYNNCIGKTFYIKEWDWTSQEYVSNKYVVPVFADVAYKDKFLEQDSATYDKLEEGKLTAWTPKRAIQYLAFLQKLSYRNRDFEVDRLVYGVNEEWRSLLYVDDIVLDYKKWESISGVAVDRGTDPLDRKLNSVNLQGKTWAGALDTILKIARTHELNLSYLYRTREVEVEVDDGEGGTTTETNYELQQYTELELIPSYATAQNNDDNLSMGLQISGEPSDLGDFKTIYDFQAFDDWRNVASAVYAESDSVKVEGTLSTENLSILPAWDTMDEDIFKSIIHGNPTTGYAMVPNNLPYPTQTAPVFPDDYSDADGNEGRPIAYRFDKTAVALARSICPDVFRKYRIDSTTSEVSELLDGLPPVGEDQDIPVPTGFSINATMNSATVGDSTITITCDSTASFQIYRGNTITIDGDSYISLSELALDPDGSGSITLYTQLTNSYPSGTEVGVSEGWATSREDFYSDTEKYPRLKKRGILSKQLQFLFSDPDDQQNEETFTTTRYPIRLWVMDDNNNKYLEGNFVSIQLANDYTFYINNAENLDSEFDCLYNGTLFNSYENATPNPLLVTPKDFKLNVALKLDHRTSAFQKLGDTSNDISTGLVGGTFAFGYGNELGGPPLRYLDVQGYSTEMQVNSNPSPLVGYTSYNESTGEIEIVSPPLNRYLPSGNNGIDLEELARRRLRDESVSSRSSTFKMVGIRTDVKTGIFISSIMPVVGDSNGNAYSIDVSVNADGSLKTAQPYPIDDNIREIKYDFHTNFDTTVSFRSTLTNSI